MGCHNCRSVQAAGCLPESFRPGTGTVPPCATCSTNGPDLAGVPTTGNGRRSTSCSNDKSNAKKAIREVSSRRWRISAWRALKMGRPRSSHKHSSPSRMKSVRSAAKASARATYRSIRCRSLSTGEPAGRFSHQTSIAIHFQLMNQPGPLGGARPRTGRKGSKKLGRTVATPAI